MARLSLSRCWAFVLPLDAPASVLVRAVSALGGSCRVFPHADGSHVHALAVFPRSVPSDRLATLAWACGSTSYSPVSCPDAYARWASGHVGGVSRACA